MNSNTAMERRKRFLTSIDVERIRRLIKYKITKIEAGSHPSEFKKAEIESWTRTAINFERAVEEGGILCHIVPLGLYASFSCWR
jgi:hypothetical protein